MVLQALYCDGSGLGAEIPELLKESKRIATSFEGITPPPSIRRRAHRTLWLRYLNALILAPVIHVQHRKAEFGNAAQQLLTELSQYCLRPELKSSGVFYVYHHLLASWPYRLNGFLKPPNYDSNQKNIRSWVGLPQENATMAEGESSVPSAIEPH